MKNYNKSIKVEVEIDNIAQQLLSSFNIDGKHNVIIVESIIDGLLSTNNNIAIANLYNSLNGYSNDINFAIGEEIVCSVETAKYFAPDSKTVTPSAYVREYVEIGVCTILDINVFQEDKLKVGFEYNNSRGELVDATLWVNHRKCNKVSTEFAV